MDELTRRRLAARALVNRQLPTTDAADEGKKPWYHIASNAAADEADIYLYNEIGYWGVSAQQFALDLKDIKENTINVRINSPGGSVFEGQAIYNLLSQHPAKIIVWIDGWAASIASVIAQAGDVRNISENAYVMIHEPWSFAMGTADDMRAEADVLDGLEETILDIYVDRTGGDRKALQKQVKAETWFKGQEAVDAGFADNLIKNKKKNTNDESALAVPPAATFGADFFATIFNLPEEVKNALAQVAASAAPAATVPAASTEPVAIVEFDVSAATPRQTEAWLRGHGATHKQAKAMVSQLKPATTETVVTGETEPAPRDEEAKRNAEKSRDEAVKAVEAVANATAVLVATFNTRS